MSATVLDAIVTKDWEKKKKKHNPFSKSKKENKLIIV